MKPGVDPQTEGNIGNGGQRDDGRSQVWCLVPEVRHVGLFSSVGAGSCRTRWAGEKDGKAAILKDDEGLKGDPKASHVYYRKVSVRQVIVSKDKAQLTKVWMRKDSTGRGDQTHISLLWTISRATSAAAPRPWSNLIFALVLGENARERPT